MLLFWDLLSCLLLRGVISFIYTSSRPSSERGPGDNKHSDQLHSFFFFFEGWGAQFFVFIYPTMPVFLFSSFSLAWGLLGLLGKWHQLRWEGCKHKINSSNFHALATPGESWRDMFLQMTQGPEGTTSKSAPSGSQPKITICLKSMYSIKNCWWNHNHCR